MIKKIYVVLILISICSTAFAQVTSGLISKYSFSGNSNDEVGINNGTVVGATLTADRFGHANSAYHFDGTSGDHIDLGTDTSLKQSTMSISLWFNIDTNTCYNSGLSYEPFVIAQNANYPGGYFEAYALGFWFSNNKVIDITYQSGTSSGPYTLSNNAVNYHNWHHAVISFDYDSLYFYLDDILQTRSYKGFTTTYLPNSPIELGYTGNAAKEAYLHGSLDDIRFYKKTLSQKEVDTLYHLTATGINNLTENSLIKLFPNPTNSIFTLALNSSNDATIKVFDVMGNLILEKNVAKKNEIQINVADLSSGIYFVELLQNNTLIRGKFIKQ